MEHERLVNEKQSIRDSARQLKKYGSTCNHVRNNEQLIRHELEKTDTLQGIALKYGCTTEQIRRTNRLFAQDSLFLRQYLMIPIDRDSVYYNKKTDRPQSLPSRAASIDVMTSDNNRTSTMPKAASTTPTDAYAEALSPEEESRKSMDEFLEKIDSTIAKTKTYVAKSQKSPNNDYFASFDDNASSSTSHNHDYNQHHQPHTGYYQRQANSQRNGNEHGPAAQVMVMAQGRRIQTSLHRHEQQQDELYQL